MLEINLILGLINLILGIVCRKQGLTGLALFNFFFFGFNYIFVLSVLILEK